MLWLSTKQNNNLTKSSFNTLPDGKNFPLKHVVCSHYCKYRHFPSNKGMYQIIPIPICTSKPGSYIFLPRNVGRLKSKCVTKGIAYRDLSPN